WPRNTTTPSTSPCSLTYPLFSFFQAEDGRRCGHVTGVQTSALPIYGHLLDGTPPPALHARGTPGVGSKFAAKVKDVHEFLVALRSEERRVGKECRSRRSA